MPAVKNVLKHLRIEQAGAKRKCERHPTKHAIKKGDLCLVVQNGQDAPNYCMECADVILALAQDNLDSLRELLNQSSPSRNSAAVGNSGYGQEDNSW